MVQKVLPFEPLEPFEPFEPFEPLEPFEPFEPFEPLLTLRTPFYAQAKTNYPPDRSPHPLLPLGNLHHHVVLSTSGEFPL